MGSKLGPHTQQMTPDGEAWCKVTAIVKALNDSLRPLSVASRAKIKLYRLYFPSYDLSRSGQSYMQELLAALGPAPATHVQFWNETAQRLSEGLDRVVTIHSEAHDYLLTVRPDLKMVGYGFSVGVPDEVEWAYLKAHNYGNVDVLGLNQYWGNLGPTAPWTALRHRKVHEWTGGAHPPIIITECGRDAVDGGQPGWRLTGLTAQEYIDELMRFDQAIGQDGYVLGAALFLSGGYINWRNFEVDGLHLEQHFKAGEESMAWDRHVAFDRMLKLASRGAGYNPHTAIMKAWALHPEWGLPLTAEESEEDWPYVLIAFANGIACWAKATGTVTFGSLESSLPLV